MKPTCFTDDAHFIHWLATDKVFHNRSGGQRQTQTFVCTDCTPTFATKMRLEGKCDHPDVEFKRVNGGELVGVKPAPKKEPRVLRTNAEAGDSGMTGVNWHYHNQRWLVQFRRNGEIHDGGYFHELEDAKAACVALDKLNPLPKKEPRVMRTKAEVGEPGMTGVHWHYQSQRWVVQVRRDGITRRGGQFRELEEAKAACAAILEKFK